MSSSSERKLKEKELLIGSIFPTPLAQAPESLLLFRACRDKGGPYCSMFQENGYTEKFEPFKTEEVVAEATRMLGDEDFAALASANKEKMNSWRDFKGEFYTYDHQSRSLRVHSDWSSIEKDLGRFQEDYGSEGLAVLSAIREVNVEHDKSWGNYYLIHTLAKKTGLGKGWFKILSDLELKGIVARHKGDISIPEELRPLVTRFLSGVGN